MNKKDIEREAAGLRRAGKAELPAKETADEQLRAIGQATRSAEAFGEAQACADCARVRQIDPEGLCREHLAKAMGF